MKQALLYSLAAIVTALSIHAQSQPSAPTNAPSRLAQERALATNRPPATPLSQEQQARVREITGKTREEQRPIAEKLRNARREMEVAAQADQVDEKLIREKAALVGQLEGELALLRAKQYKQLREVLPTDQLDRYKAAAVPPGPATNKRLQSIVTNRTAVPAPAAQPNPAPKQ